MIDLRPLVDDAPRLRTSGTVNAIRDNIAYSIQPIRDGVSLMQVRDITGETSTGGLVTLPTDHARRFIRHLNADPMQATSTDGFSRSRVFTALCIWEWMQEQFDDPQSPWDELRANVGSNEMRDACIDLAGWLEEVVAECVRDDPLVFDAWPYDWDVVPAVMEYAILDTGEPCIAADQLPGIVNVAVLVKNGFKEREAARKAS